MPPPSGAPTSGCRICGPGARAPTSRCRRAGCALAPGDVVGADGRRPTAAVRDRARSSTPRPRAFRRARSIRRCSTCRCRAPRRRRAGIAGGARPGACAACSICRRCPATTPPVLTRLAVFADPWPGAVAVWRSLDGASYQRVAVADAPADRSARRSTICRPARRAAGTRPRRCACSSTAARWRR